MLSPEGECIYMPYKPKCLCLGGSGSGYETKPLIIASIFVDFGLVLLT